MADEEVPAVTLGEGEPVEGAPLARVSARLMWGIEKSAVVEREGETVVRTPEGPRELAAVLEAVDQPYFATRREFEDAVRDVVGRGPVPTDGESDTGTTSETGSETDAEADTETGADADADSEAGGDAGGPESEESN